MEVIIPFNNYIYLFDDFLMQTVQMIIDKLIRKYKWIAVALHVLPTYFRKNYPSSIFDF